MLFCNLYDNRVNSSRLELALGKYKLKENIKSTSSQNQKVYCYALILLYMTELTGKYFG